MSEATADRVKLGSVVERRDMYFHEPRYRDYRWFETNWFTWTIPERAMRGHLRAGFRTNMNVVESTCFVFDNPDPRAGRLGVLYSDKRSHVPMPPTNLDHYDLVSGAILPDLKCLALPLQILLLLQNRLTHISMAMANLPCHA